MLGFAWDPVPRKLKGIDLCVGSCALKAETISYCVGSYALEAGSIFLGAGSCA